MYCWRKMWAKSFGRNTLSILGDQKCRDDLEYISPERTRRDSRSPTATASGPHALKEYMSAVVAVAARNCSLLLTSHPCCISAQTLIRTNGTRVHALRNTEREIPRENAHEQRPERDPGTDMFYPDILFRACCFIRVPRHIFISRIGRASILNVTFVSIFLFNGKMR